MGQITSREETAETVRRANSRRGLQKDSRTNMGSPSPVSAAANTAASNSIPIPESRRRSESTPIPSDNGSDSGSAHIAQSFDPNELEFNNNDDNSHLAPTNNNNDTGNNNSNSNNNNNNNNAGTVPVVFAWRGGGHQVAVTGTFNDWTVRIPLSNSHGEFTTIVNLPPGKHQYKFVVDGEWHHDPQGQQVPDPFGSCNNVVDVGCQPQDSFVSLANTQSLGSEPSGTFGQETPIFTAKTNPPPHLPPQLLQAVLNLDAISDADPTLLPQPQNHAMLNHLYALSIREGVMVLGATHRYKQKYITTVLYRPVYE